MWRKWLAQYVVAGVTFGVLDAVWLTVVAADMYAARLGERLAPSPDPVAATLFYLVYVTGLVYFVVSPAVEAGSWRRALGAGAFFGLVTYATWGLTNLAVLANWPVGPVVADLAWGTVLTATAGVVTVTVVQRLRLPGPA